MIFLVGVAHVAPCPRWGRGCQLPLARAVRPSGRRRLRRLAASFGRALVV